MGRPLHEQVGAIVVHSNSYCGALWKSWVPRTDDEGVYGLQLGVVSAFRAVLESVEMNREWRVLSPMIVKDLLWTDGEDDARATQFRALWEKVKFEQNATYEAAYPAKFLAHVEIVLVSEEGSTTRGPPTLKLISTTHDTPVPSPEDFREKLRGACAATGAHLAEIEVSLERLASVGYKKIESIGQVLPSHSPLCCAGDIVLLSTLSNAAVCRDITLGPAIEHNLACTDCVVGNTSCRNKKCCTRMHRFFYAPQVSAPKGDSREALEDLIAASTKGVSL